MTKKNTVPKSKLPSTPPVVKKQKRSYTVRAPKRPAVNPSETPTPQYVYVVTIKLGLPSTIDGEGKEVEGISIMFTALFNAYPTVEAVLAYIEADECMATMPRFDTFLKLAAFGLTTWGIPRLPSTKFDVLTVHGVTTPWIANIEEQQTTYFGHQFGLIRVAKKPVH